MSNIASGFVQPLTKEEIKERQTNSLKDTLKDFMQSGTYRDKQKSINEGFTTYQNRPHGFTKK